MEQVETGWTFDSHELALFFSPTTSTYPIIGAECYCCTGLQNETHDVGRTPVRVIGPSHSPLPTQHKQTNVHVLSGTRTRDSRNLTVAYLHLRQQGHLYRSVNNSSSASADMPCILWKLKVHYRFHIRHLSLS
jgi:hypothetical protein